MKHRLQRILQILVNSSQIEAQAQIWDMCCDHGELAIAIAKSLPRSHVIALDVVPEIIENLKDKLQKKYPLIDDTTYQISDSKLTAACQDARVANTRETDVAIICGVGSDLIIEIINSLKIKPKHLILCSHKNPIKLRNYLHNSLWGLSEEHLFYDRGQYYECYFMDHAIHEKISSVGSPQFWLKGERALEYLNRRTHELSLKHQTQQVLQEFEQLKAIKLNVLKQ